MTFSDFEKQNIPHQAGSDDVDTNAFLSLIKQSLESLAEDTSANGSELKRALEYAKAALEYQLSE